MAEGARLESVYTATYRGFESPPHRHILRRARTQVRAFFFSHVAPTGGDENPRPGFDNWQRQLDRPRACERAAPQGRAKRVNPPLTVIFKEKRVRKYELFSHFICLYGSERYKNRVFLSVGFLSCLYGSELKYYTFSPLLIKHNHPILLQHPFLSLPSSSTNYHQLTFTSKNRVFTVPPYKQKVRNLFRDYGLHQPT